MVLHHVANGAVFVIVGPAILDTDGLGDGDLHVIDADLVPEWFEQRIGEAQRQEILHRFLAEVVVDAEDAIFGEYSGQRLVDLAIARKIVADRLFHHDAAVAAHETRCFQVLADAAVMCGRGRKVEDELEHALKRPSEGRKRSGIRCVDADIREPGAEFLPGFLVEAVFGAFADGFLHERDKRFGRHLRPRAADNRDVLGQEAIFVKEVQRRE